MMVPAQVRPELDPLVRERKEIERRRERFEDRRKRILHAKTRIIGVDTDSLSAQIVEKQSMNAAESEREKFYDDQTLSHARIIGAHQTQKQQEEKRTREQLAFYRQQQAAEKREKDAAERANYKQYHSQSTSGNPDSTLFLKFQGEDEQYNDRVKLQQAQQQQWLAQQLYLEEEKQARQRAEEADYAKYQSQILQIQDENQKLKSQQEKDRLRSTTQYNQSLHQNKLMRQQAERASNQFNNETELSNQLRSRFLNEDTSIYNNSNVNFKGFSSAERQRILQEQAYQQQLKQQQRQREIEEEKQYAEQQEQFRRTIVQADRVKAQQDLAARLALKEERQFQHKQKNAREQYLNQVVYQNPVAPEYFEQFGTSHR